MSALYIIRKIILSFISLIILVWAFRNNGLGGRIIITPFLICSFALLNENLFLLLKKNKTANIFKYIFRISLFAYFFGFLSYAGYYAVVNKEYSLFIPIAIFLPFMINFFKNSFFRQK